MERGKLSFAWKEEIDPSSVYAGTDFPRAILWSNRNLILPTQSGHFRHLGQKSLPRRSGVVWRRRFSLPRHNKIRNTQAAVSELFLLLLLSRNFLSSGSILISQSPGYRRRRSGERPPTET